MRNRVRSYRCEAVVLHRQDFGEADRFLTVFSREQGKLRLLAKGVRKPRSRKAGHVEPLTRTLLLNARGREIDIVNQAEALDLFEGVRVDLVSLGRAAYMAELIDRFSVEGETNRQLYRLLVDSFSRLSENPPIGYAVIRYFEIRLLEIMGYRPELFHCVECNEEIRPEDQYFSRQGGGLVCARCGNSNRDLEPITLPALKVLRHFQRNSFEVASTAKVDDRVHKEIDRIMELFLSYLLEQKLNSPGFIREVSTLAPYASTSISVPISERNGEDIDES